MIKLRFSFFLHITQILYSISASTPAPFRVNSTTGVITTSESFDRENIAQYSFEMIASDQGAVSQSGHAVVSIGITDANDNSPIFAITLPDPVQIRETEEPGFVIGTVQASDNDEENTPNSEIKYSITGGSGVGVFAVDPETGNLTLSATLDFENVSSYSLDVTATDQGEIPQNSTLNLSIMVIDRDDNIPIFNSPTYTFSFAEGNNVSAFVGRVEANDVDLFNQTIGYAIESGTPYLPFEINQTTGEIRANETINRETLEDPQFTLNIVTFYVETPKNVTDRATVLIEIVDINEFMVTIDTFELETINENTMIGMQVGSVIATDQDPTSQLVYTLTITQNLLRIDASGNIFVNRIIDRESAIFNAAVCPPGTPPNISCLPTILTVRDTTTGERANQFQYLRVSDIDDEPPIFSRDLYTLNISESVPEGYPLSGLSIEASDSDYNVNLMFSIPPNQDVTDFQIQQASGLITVAQGLDYERTEYYQFVIIVEDSLGNQDNATVLIYIIDENDNSPIFDFPAYFETIPENFPVNDEVITVRATDTDSTSNEELTYNIYAGNTNDAFRIDFESGVISLTSALNREDVSYYSLTVTATDDGSVPRTGMTIVNLTISDINDHPPRFLESEYRGFVIETAEIGAPILNSMGQPLEITYNDPDVDAIVMITLLGQFPFSIDSATGLLTVTEPLDFEQVSSYNIILAIQDDLGFFGGPANLVIQLNATNDHPPDFDQPSYSVSIDENSRDGEVILQVETTDLDGAEIITYAIVDEDNSGDIFSSSGMSIFPFELNSLTGELVLLRELDYEMAPEWRFSISATDLGGLSATADVTITVNDLNDNSPQFAESVFEIAIPENFTASFTIPASTAITASDADSVSEGNLLYLILSGANGLFQIDRRTGTLFVIGPLNVGRVYELQLLVSDGINEGTAVARVQVMDINNNSPVFSQDAYSAEILEFSPPETFVLFVSATDDDVGIFSQISYFLLPSDDANSFFINETSGEIITASGSTFDYLVQNEFQFQVEARDGADPPRNTVVNVTVNLEDVNNNPPVFTMNPFRVDVSEATPIGMSVFEITASDDDIGIDDAQMYFELLTQNSSFTIERETGIVQLVDSDLDFDDPDTLNTISLEISVNDGVFNNTGQLIISITDENDNVPTFEAPLIQILIPENAEIGDVAFVMNATDLDSGVNGDVTYTVLSILPLDCMSRFNINDITGVVILAEEVDLEPGSAEAQNTGEPCTLVVRAMDAGTPSRTSQTTYVVIVTNINEFPPTVNPDSLFRQIPENTPNGTFVLQIDASDRDGNGIIYQVAGGDTEFFDLSESGCVTVAQNIVLDREIQSMYYLVVNVRDDGLPIMTTTVSVTVTLTDENDNSPMFVRPNFIQSVRENHTLNTPPILFVLATDDDIAPNNVVQYMFVANSDNEIDYGLFGIDSATGAIFLTGTLDYEQEPRAYHLQVEAFDGNFTTKAQVSIRVLESNDLAPMFLTPPGTIFLSEDAGNEALVTQVEAVDMDQGVNGKITYTLEDPSGKFAINPNTGIISVVGDNQFDFESNVQEYAIRAIATDNAGMVSSGDNTAEMGSTFGHAPLVDPNDRPLTSTLSLIIRITDVNDNPPQFTEAEYVALIIEHEQLPLLVVTVQATDADEAGQDNSIVRYRLVGEGRDRFQIDSVRGEIRTIPPIDRETQEFYELLVQAYDLGVPEQVTNVTVTVTIVDTDDNRPLFPQRRYVGIVEENSDSGTSVITVTAIDSDNIAATLNYTVLNGNPFFDIELQTGVIFTRVRLDREEMPDPILFNVQATDADGFAALTEVVVSVADVNDERPEFDQGLYSFTISENMPLGEIFGRVIAEDADLGSNAISEYFFEDGNDLFTTEPLTGDLLVFSSLCFSDAASIVYSLEYIAIDTGIDYFNGSTTVEVTVFKENNFAPQFVQPSYISRLDELAPAGTEVLAELRTTDEDLCSGPPIFEIFSEEVANTFEIDSNTGRIVLVRSLTTDDLGFTLTLRATDTNNFDLPDLFSEVTLIVLVGQLLPISMVVSNGLTVPTISRFSTEEYQQDIWIPSASLLSSSPEVTYILGDLQITASIPVEPANASSLNAVVLERTIYPDSSRLVLIGIQVMGKGFERASIAPTSLTINVGPSNGTCITMSPTGGCIAAVELPESVFTAETTLPVSYSTDFGSGSLGTIQTVEANPCPISSDASQINVDVPNRLVYPGQEFDVTLRGRTQKQVDYFSVSCEFSDGLEFQELVSYPNGFVVSYAFDDNIFTLSGSDNRMSLSASEYSFEIIASISLDEDANVNVSSPLSIACNVNTLTNRDGEAEIFNTPANHTGPIVGMCNHSIANVLGTPNAIVTLFSYASSTVIINTAILNGERVTESLSVQGLLASGDVTTDLTDLYCESMNERVLQVEEDCSLVYINGSETDRSKSVRIQISASSLTSSVDFQVWYPSGIQLVLGEEVLDPIANLFQGQCEPVYESTDIQVEGFFSSGSDNLVVYITEFVANNLQSSDNSILIVENNRESYSVRAQGVASGSAYVWFTDTFGRIYQSPVITVSSASATIEGISLSLHSDLVPRSFIPVVPGVPSFQTTIVALEADFNHLDVQVDILAEAVLSNGRNFELSNSHGLSFRSTNSEVIQIVDSDIIVRGTGTGRFLIAELDQTDCDVNITVSEYVEVALNPIESIELAFSNTTLALEPHSEILNLPDQTSYEVYLVHQDGTRVRVTDDDRVVLMSSTLPTIEGGMLSTTQLNISHVGNHTISAVYMYDTNYMISGVIDIIGIQDLTLTAASYPGDPFSPEYFVLERFNNTNIYQQAQLMVFATVSNGDSIDLTETDFVSFNLDSSIATLDNLIVTPTNYGNLTITASLETLSDDIVLMISNETVSAIIIASFTYPTNGTLLQGTALEVISPSVSVIFSDNVAIPDIATYNSALALATVSFSATSDPSVIVDEHTGDVTLLRNSLYTIVVQADLINGIGSGNVFSVDLIPVLGQVDVTGLLDEATGRMFSVELRLNIGEEELAAFEAEVYYNSSELQVQQEPGTRLPVITPGGDLPTSSILRTSYADHDGMFRIGLLVSDTITTSLPHIATLQFTALTSYVPYFYIIVNTVVNEDMETIGETTPKVSQASIFNFDPSNITVSQPPVTCAAPPCSPEECLAIGASIVPGDANADCVFDLRDALFTQQVLAQLALPENDLDLSLSQMEAVDPDRNGETNPLDIQFLMNARLGIYPLVSDLLIRSVNSEFGNCRITINLTLHEYDGQVNDGAFMYLGIFHDNAEFQSQFDDTAFNIGEKMPDILLPIGAFGGWLQPESFGEGLYGLQTNPGPISQSDIGLVILYGTLNPQGIPTKEQTWLLTGTPTIPPRYNSLSANFNQSSVTVELNTFNPTLSFDNSFSANLCFNRNSPQFNPLLGNPILTRQREDVTGVLREVSATDQDAPLPAGDIRFSLINVNPPGVIDINSTTGDIFVVGTLDREEYQFIRSTIVATDQGPDIFTRLSDEIQFEVELVDVNDNPPLADEPFYDIGVLEDVPVISGMSMSVFEFSGSDLDATADNNGLLSSHTVLQDGSVSSVFVAQTSSISREGNGSLFTISLHLIQSLDRETRDTYNLTVILQDNSALFPLSSTVEIRVRVLDANDLRPVFDSPGRVGIRENNMPGTAVIQVRAVDNDIGPNAVFNFTINSIFIADDLGAEGSNPVPALDYFSIDPLTGSLTANRVLDREGAHSFVVNLLAEEMNVADNVVAASHRIWVMVCEENDNAPIFNQSSFETEIAENSLEDTFVMRFTAIDRDLGSFCDDPIDVANAMDNQFRYDLITKDVPFYVDELTGGIFVDGDLDYEMIENYTIIIETTDFGIPPQSSMTNVTISVIDLNDNSPVLQNRTYFNLAVENSTVPTTVIDFISATDADSGDNALINYQLTGTGSEDFKIVLETGEIVTAVSLDRERQSRYVLTVTAFNPNNPDRNDSAEVIIELIDINDTPPVFSMPMYVTDVSENLPIGGLAIVVNATDSDENANRNIRYFIEEPHPLFTIDSVSGEITSLGSLCTIEDVVYNLVVTAEDNPGAELRFTTPVNVTLNIRDDNSNDPIFSRPEYAVVLPDAIESGIDILTVSASDEDICSPPFTYSISISEPINNQFAINSSSGVVSTNNVLLSSEAETYFVTILATDSGTNNVRTGTATLIVKVGESVPVDFTTSIGYSLSNPLKTAEENDVSTYQQEFDFLFNIDTFESPVVFEAQFGDISQSESIEVGQYPATRVNAVLLTPEVAYDERVAKIALGITDMFGSSRVSDADVFVEIEFNSVIASSNATTTSTRTIVNVDIPRQWFATSETRMVNVRYGVVGNNAIQHAEMISLVPEPDYRSSCGFSKTLLIAQLPHRAVYNDEVFSVPILAQRSSDFYINSFSLSCSLENGLQFEEEVFDLTQWATGEELNDDRTEVRLIVNRIGAIQEEFEFEELVSLRIRVSDNSKSLSMSCNLLEAVDSNGDFEQYTDILMVDRDGCQLNTGTVNPSVDTIIGALHASRQTVLINDAVLSGQQKSIFPTVVSIVMAAEPRFDDLLSRGTALGTLECSSEDNNAIQVRTTCSEIFVVGSELIGSMSVNIILTATSVQSGIAISNRAFPVNLEYQVWYPEIPIEISIVDDTLNLVEGWVTDPLNTGTCVPAYQETIIEATATFKRLLSETGVSVRVEELLTLTPTVENIVAIQQNSVTGISVGTTMVQARNPNTNAPVSNSLEIVVNDDTLRAVEIDTSVGNSLSIVTPDSIPYLGVSTFLANIDSSLSYSGQSAMLVSTVIFSDAVRRRENNEITYFSLNSSIVSVNGNEVTVFAEPSEDNLIVANWRSTCDGSVVLSRPVNLDIEFVVPVIRVFISDTVLIHSSDPAAIADVVTVPTQSTVIVQLVYYKDDEEIRSVDVTNDPMTRFTFSEDDVVTISSSTGNTMILRPAAASISGSVDLTVGYLALEEATPITLYTGYSSRVDIETRFYPAFDGSENTIADFLQEIGNTGQYHQAQIIATLNVDFPEEAGVQSNYDITNNSFLSYSSDDGSIISATGIVTPQAAGTSVLSVMFVNTDLTDSFDVTITNIRIPVNSISVSLSNGEAIVGNIGEIVDSIILASVGFADGTRLEEAFTPSGQTIPGLFEITNNNPDVFTIDPVTNRFTILRYTPNPVSITLEANQNIAISETFYFYTNLEPEAGELDLGAENGRPISSVEQGETFEVPLRFNIDLSGAQISALEIGVSYSDNLIELIGISPGSFWTAESRFESSLREFRGFVYLGGLVNNQPATSGIVDIAQLSFRSLNGVSGLAAIDARVIKLLDSSSPPQDIFASLPSSPAASIGVFVNSTEEEGSLPVLQVDTAMDALQPTVTLCSGGVSVDGVETGDINGDCIFNLDDVLAFQDAGCTAYPDVDVDYDGICDSERDLQFLLRANFRIVRFVQSVSVTPVTNDDCFLTIDATLTGRGSPVANGAQTSLMIGLFHRSPGFQQEVDDTTISLNFGRIINSGDYPVSSSGGFFEAASQDSSSIAYRAVLRAAIAREDIGVVLVQARVDAFGTVSSDDRAEIMTRYDSIPTYFPERVFATIEHPFVNIPFEFEIGFNPLMLFNQTFSSLVCINEGRPIFFPFTTEAEVFENITMGSFVAQVFANDSDAGANAEVVYSLGNDSISLPFVINASTGILTLDSESTLDREMVDSYFVTLNAVDRGVLSVLAGVGELIVTVLDVNDNPPIFEQDPFEFFGTPENAPIETYIGTVTATDADIGLNAELSFSFSETSTQFRIDSETGEIFSIAEFDFEEQMMYTLNVIATDRGTPSLSATGAVIVNIDPVNDNSPECEPIERTAMLPEDEVLDFNFFYIEVEDADLGADHNVLNFTLTTPSSEFGVRNVDDMTGALYTRVENFDRLTTPSYNLTVFVSDVDGQNCMISITVIVAEPSRFFFDLNPSNPMGGFFTSPVRPRPEKDGFDRDASFFRSFFPEVFVSADNDSFFAQAQRAMQPIMRIDGIIREDNVWSDKPIINVAAQARAVESLGPNVDYSNIHLEINAVDTSDSISGSSCLTDMNTTLQTGICLASVEVPLLWFSQTSAVEVVLVGEDIRNILGTVNLRQLPLPANVSDNLVVELPSFSLYQEDEFYIWVGAPSQLNVQAMQFDVSLPVSLTPSAISNSDWRCSNVFDTDISMTRYACIRLDNKQETTSPLGTTRFFSIPISISDNVTITDNMINVTTVSLVNNFGSIINFPTATQIYSMIGLTIGSGPFNIVETTVRGMFAGLKGTAEIVNLTPLNGIPQLSNIWSAFIYNRITNTNIDFGDIVTDGNTCNTGTSTISLVGCKVQAQNETASCLGNFTVSVSNPMAPNDFEIPMREWCINPLTLDFAVTDNVLNRVTSACNNFYQEAKLSLYGSFYSGEEQGPLVNIAQVTSFTSSNSSVASINFETVVGMNPGMATIFLQYFPNVSVDVMVTNEQVDVYRVYPTIFSSIDLRINPTEFTADSTLTTSAIINQNFNSVGILLRKFSFVYFTDGARYDIPSELISIETITPDVINSDSLTTAGPGEGILNVTWIPSGCTVPLASSIVSVTVALPQPEALVLELSSNAIIRNSLGVNLAETPSSVSLSVTAMVGDDLVVPDSFTYMTSNNLIINNELNIVANTTFSAASGTVTVTLGDLVETVTIEVLDIADIEVGLQSYPIPVSAPATSISLHQIANTNYQQQAQITTQALLSNGRTETVTNAAYEITSQNDAITISSDGVVTPASALGTTNVNVTAGQFSSSTVTVAVLNSPQPVRSIDKFELEELSQTQRRVIADVTFGDNTVITDVINFNSELSSLLTFDISPPNVATFDTSTWILTIIDNYYNFVTLTVTDGSNSRMLTFSANLLPVLGEIDLGQTNGIPQPPISSEEEFVVDVRVNTGGENIGALEVNVNYDPNALELVSIDNVVAATMIARTNSPPGDALFAFLTVAEITENIPTIARLTFRSRNIPGVTSVVTNANVLVDSSLSTFSTDAMSISRLNVLVESDTGAMNVITPKTASIPAFINRVDTNRDGMFNILDPVTILGTIEGNGPCLAIDDANNDSVVTFADVFYLSQVSTGLLPLFDSFDVINVESDDDCMLEIQVNLLFNEIGPVQNNTFVFVILSYTNESELIALSRPEVEGRSSVILDSTSVMFEANPQSEGSSSFVLRLFTPISKQYPRVGATYLIMSTDEFGETSAQRFASFIKSNDTYVTAEMSQVPQLNDINVVSQRNPSVRVNDASIGSFNGFHPFNDFTNELRSDYCRFDGAVFEGTVLENVGRGTLVFMVSAVEDMFPENNETYDIDIEGLPFMLSPDGYLTVNGVLDFETESVYSLLIQGIDSENVEFGIATLNITLIDVNDFAPMFTNPDFNVTISEDRQPNNTTAIFNATATDPDQGINGEFFFSLEDPQQLFVINNLTGSVYQIGYLDREVQSSYSLNLTVTDLALESKEVLFSSTTLEITVLDVNDNSPMLINAPYTFYIPENFFTNTTVRFDDDQVVAMDPDSEANGEVVLTLIALDANSPFLLSDDGYIEVTGELDREEQDRYEFIINVTDNGTPPLTGSTTLSIIVVDINDNDPVFLPGTDIMVTVEEDIQLGTVISTFIAVDNDTGNNSIITYSLEDANIPFGIDPQTGELSISDTLNVGINNTYDIVVTASDSGIPPVSTSHNLLVNIIEGQVIDLNLGEDGFTFGSRMRTSATSYTQSVGYLFGQNIGTTVSVNARLNTATSGTVDQLPIPNQGNVATQFISSVLNSEVNHSLKTVTVFMQALDSRNTIARPTVMRARVTASESLRQLGGPSYVDTTCTTSEELGFCIAQAVLPDEWFARSATDPAQDTVIVWVNFDSENTPGHLTEELVVENSPVYAVDLTTAIIEPIPLSHSILPGKNFSIEVFVVSPLVNNNNYDRVEADIVWEDAQISLVDISFDMDFWSCSKCYILVAKFSL